MPAQAAAAAGAPHTHWPWRLGADAGPVTLPAEPSDRSRSNWELESTALGGSSAAPARRCRGVSGDACAMAEEAWRPRSLPSPSLGANGGTVGGWGAKRLVCTSVSE